MTKTGGMSDVKPALRLVVAVDARAAHPADVTASSAVRRMRTASLNDQWHALLADVYVAALEGGE